MGPRVVKEHSTLDEGETGEDRNSQARKISSLVLLGDLSSAAAD